MKTKIIFALLIAISSINAEEFALTSMSVESYDPNYEITLNADLTFRELIDEGDLSGTYMTVKSRCMLSFNMTMYKQVRDSLITFIDVFSRWKNKASETSTEFVKEIGSFYSVCLFTNIVGDADVGRANITLKFGSNKSKETGRFVIYLMVYISEVEGRINEYNSCKTPVLFFTPEEAKKLQSILKSIPELKKAAVEKQKSSEMFTR